MKGGLIDEGAWQLTDVEAFFSEVERDGRGGEVELVTVDGMVELRLQSLPYVSGARLFSDAGTRILRLSPTRRRTRRALKK